jgi:predicted porin
MNNTIKLAVAAALVAAASSANAGISIPAGDWTVDIGGNVNAFYIHNNSSDDNDVDGGLANRQSGNADNNSSGSSINTGLLPSWLGIGAKTRQNDLDVGWTISFQPGASSAHALQGGGGSEFRQAFITFGDKSWGTIKIGKDLGLFGSNAILNDQTLLGVGSQGLVGAAGGTTTTLGRIGTGFLYADFKGQINYTSPNWNGFSFTAGIAQPWNSISLADALTPAVSSTSSGAQQTPAFEGQVQYDWAGDLSGKVWGEFFTQKVDGIGATSRNQTARAFGLGGKLAVAGFDAVAYYYDAKGVGTTALLADGFDLTGKRRDSDGWYLQAGFTIPGAGTRIAASYGESNLDRNSAEVKSTLVEQNDMWTVGVYHPLTKHLNLVAEYSQVQAENQLGADNKSNIVDLGAILFF